MMRGRMNAEKKHHPYAILPRQIGRLIGFNMLSDICIKYEIIKNNVLGMAQNTRQLNFFCINLIQIFGNYDIMKP